MKPISRFVAPWRRRAIRPRVRRVIRVRCDCSRSLHRSARRATVRHPLRHPSRVAAAEVAAAAHTDCATEPRTIPNRPDVGDRDRLTSAHEFVDPRNLGGRRGRGDRCDRCPGSGSQAHSEADSDSGAQGTAPLTLYVDECRWWFRDRQWCHLVSDSSLDELHDFASALGVSTRAFHGDHYDLPEEWRSRAVESGAVEVSSRELLGRLRDSGLRLSASVRRSALDS